MIRKKSEQIKSATNVIQNKDSPIKKSEERAHKVLEFSTASTALQTLNFVVPWLSSDGIPTT